jgi:ferric-dicitrate binding protein FerR (iron transport regulator)
LGRDAHKSFRKNSDSPSEPVAADVKTFAVWRNRKLIFRNTLLSEVVKELERYHPVHERLVDPSLRLEGFSAAMILSVSGCFKSGFAG